MKTIIFVLLLSFAIGFISCGESGDNPTGAENDVPAKPENLTAEALSDSQVYLTWIDTSSFESGFYILRSIVDTTDWAWIDTLEIDADNFTDNSLEEGSQYNYRITAFNEFGVSMPSDVATATTLAKPPTDLTAEQDSVIYTTIRLSWVDASSKETGYKIQRKLSEDVFFQHYVDVDPNDTEYIDENLDINLCYCYRVCAMIDSVGSHWSNEDSASTTVPALEPPTYLTATTLSDNRIYLSWVDYSNIKTGFRIQKLSDDSSAWTTIGETDSETMVWFDTGLNEGTSYSYRVSTLRYESVSDPSAVATARTLALPPSNLIAVMDSVIFTTITLTWTDSSEKETGYQIQRKIGSRGIYEDFIELDANVEEYVDEGLDQNTTYYYHVRAMIDTVGSNWSNEASANTTDLTPDPPTDLVASAQTAHSILLTWSDNAMNNEGFIIEQSLREDEGWELTDTLKSEDAEEYTVEDLLENTTYYFRIFAYNSYFNSAYSNVASATTPLIVPNAPSDLRLVGDPTFDEVVVAWDDNSLDETYFQLQRKESGAPDFNNHAQIDANIIMYVDNDIILNREYVYRVKAVNDNGSSTYSNELTVATPNGPPYSPSITEIEALSISSIRISWAAHPINNHLGFYLERKSEHEANFYEVGGAFSRVTNTYTDTGLEDDTWYFYRIYSFNELGRSAYSNIDSAKTQLDAVFFDGFEDYDVYERPPAPWEIEEHGGSTVLVTDQDHHNGSQCVQFQDENDYPVDSAYCRAQINMGTIERGSIECWLKIADEGYFGIIGADPENYITFRIQFFGDQRIVFQNGASLVVINGFPTEEWFKLKIIFDVTERRYSFEINDEQRVENALLQRSDHEGNSTLIFLAFSDATLTYANLDDILVLETDEENRFMQYSKPSSYEDNGNVRIDNISTIVEPDR